MLGALVLGGCAGGAAGVAMPTGGAEASAAPIRIALDGTEYLATVTPGPAGTALTRVGAVPLRGRTVAVTLAEGSLGQDRGLAAKQVAERACRMSRGRFEPRAIGRVLVPGRWDFAGACA